MTKDEVERLREIAKKRSWTLDELVTMAVFVERLLDLADENQRLRVDAVRLESKVWEREQRVQCLSALAAREPAPDDVTEVTRKL